ncbi:hypothetical protein U2F10_02740 [Leptothoe sp. EHU-05/26/07-4]
MKRYLLFAWPSYEVGGGWNDFYGDFDSLEAAIDYVDQNENILGYCDYLQVVDAQTFNVRNNTPGLIVWKEPSRIDRTPYPSSS